VLGVWNTLVVQDASWFKLAPLAKLWGVWAGMWLAALIDFLRNRASSWIYTTALSPGDTAAALVATLFKQEPERRNLWRNLDYLKWLIAQRLPTSNCCFLNPPSSAFSSKVQQTPNYWNEAKNMWHFCPCYPSSHSTHKWIRISWQLMISSYSAIG